MRKFLGTIVIAAVVIAAIGYYNGWLTFGNNNGMTNSNFEVQINRSKLGDDTESLVDEAKALGKKAGDAIERVTKGN